MNIHKELDYILYYYDQALYHTLHEHWDHLLQVAQFSNDDILTKRATDLINSIKLADDELKIIDDHHDLLAYLDHAIISTPTPTIKV